jgi:hypothetical protein
MLGDYFRYQVYNGTGVTVTVTIDEIRWKFGSDGSLTFSAEQTPINASAVTTLAYGNSSGVDNGTDKYIGSHLTVLFDVASSATGTVFVYLQRSTDNGTTWPSDRQGELIGSVFFSASSTDVIKNFSVG